MHMFCREALRQQSQGKNGTKINTSLRQLSNTIRMFKGKLAIWYDDHRFLLWRRGYSECCGLGKYELMIKNRIN